MSRYVISRVFIGDDLGDDDFEDVCSTCTTFASFSFRVALVGFLKVLASFWESLKMRVVRIMRHRGHETRSCCGSIYVHCSIITPQVFTIFAG